MRNWSTSLGLVLVVVVLAGCAGGEAVPAPAVTGGDSYVSSVLDTGYEGALTVRNQLALGILNLDGTENTITPEQAATLLPLWQALRSTMRSGAAAAVEVDALLAQIEETLTPAQLDAIGAMRLTQDDLRAWAESQGITLGTGEGAGGGMGGGYGQSLSPEERATRQAERGGTGEGGGGLSTALLDEVVAFLEAQ